MTTPDIQASSTNGVVLPDNIAAFKADAANTNESPIYLGRYMLFSDQDLTSLKHNLVGTGLISTVFVGLLKTIENDAIPLPMRMVIMAGMVTTLHASTIGLWNIIQSHIQLHPSFHPKTWWHWLSAHPVAGISVGAGVVQIMQVVGPTLAATFHQTLVILGVLV